MGIKETAKYLIDGKKRRHKRTKSSNPFYGAGEEGRKHHPYLFHCLFINPKTICAKLLPSVEVPTLSWHLSLTYLHLKARQFNVEPMVYFNKCIEPHSSSQMDSKDYKSSRVRLAVYSDKDLWAQRLQSMKRFCETSCRNRWKRKCLNRWTGSWMNEIYTCHLMV